MGGVGGHMSHLYENRELTFKQLKEVLIRASSGELEGTEKTDGKNLFVSYSVQTGRAKAARNKGNIKQGGLTPEEVAQKFEGRGELTSAFVDSFKAFEKAVQSLDPETQIAIFGPDANIYYQSEVQTPSSPNVINYDTDTLVIHQVGHAQFDKETGSVADVNVSKNAKILDKVLSQMQGAIEDERFNIERNAVKTLRALDDDLALNTSLENLDNIMREAGVTDNDTIADYMIAQLTPFVERNITLSKEKMKMLIKRLFKVKGVTFNKIVKGMDRDDKEIIRAILKSENKIMKQAIAPIEHVVHDFSVEMLKGLHSAFILDNPKEVMRLRKETQQAIQAIERSGDEQAIAVLQQQMEKLKNIENISTAVEGFVFDYDGATYKFTGNFAPMNQILGLFRYGRGGKKLDLTEDEVALNDYDVDISGYDTIALVPGGFKPPHRGHLDMVKKVAGADRVLILMGSGGKSPRTIGDTVIDYNTAASIWSMLLADAGIDNYDFIEVPEGGTPIRKAFEILEHMTLPGQTVYMLTSEKDTGRFGQRLQNYAPEEVNVEAVEVPTTRSKTGEQLSARFLRDYIANNNFEEFLDYIPKESEHRAEEIYTMLGGKKKVTEEIFRIVESFLDEGDYQKSPTKKAYLKNWHKMFASGPQNPGPPFTKKRPKKVGPAPVGFSALEEEEVEEESSKKKKKKVYMEPHGHQESEIIVDSPDDDLEEQGLPPGAIPPGPESGDVEGAYTKSPFPKMNRSKKRKKRIKEDPESVEEVSAMGNGSVSFSSGGPPHVGNRDDNSKRKKKKVKYDGFAGAKDEATGNTGSFVTEDNEFIDEVLNYLLNIMES